MGRYANAVAFLGKLGMARSTAEAQLVGGVKSTTDDSLQVPCEVKKQWHRWNLKGHPDKGGGHPDKGGSKEEYNALKAEYTSFKESYGEWLDAHPTGQPDFQTWCRETDESVHARNMTRQKAQLKDNGEKALLAAKKALKEGRRNDAKMEAKCAVDHLEEYQAVYATKLGGREIREMIVQAREVEQAVRQLEEEEARRLEEEERKQRELEEAKEAMTSLEGLWQSICASITDSSFSWGRKVDVLHQHFKDKEVPKSRRLDAYQSLHALSLSNAYTPSPFCHWLLVSCCAIEFCGRGSDSSTS